MFMVRRMRLAVFINKVCIRWLSTQGGFTSKGRSWCQVGGPIGKFNDVFQELVNLVTDARFPLAREAYPGCRQQIIEFVATPLQGADTLHLLGLKKLRSICLRSVISRRYPRNE